MMQTGTIQLGSGTVEAAWWGPNPTEAPTLVLLHEGLGSVGLWRDVPERLAASTGCGVFAYSRFGYGHSDTTALPRPMTYMHHEAQIVLPEVLRATNIQRMALIGHSDGGSIAAIYAGSVAASPGWPVPSILPGHDTTCSDTTSVNHPILLGVVTIAAHFIVEDLNIASIRQIKAAYEAGNLRQRLARHHRDVDTAFHGWNDAWLDPRFRDFDITTFLPNIQVPILSLQGDADPYGTDEQLRILQASVNAPVTINLVRGAQHAPHLEAADRTLAAITSFIATLPRGLQP